MEQQQQPSIKKKINETQRLETATKNTTKSNRDRRGISSFVVLKAEGVVMVVEVGWGESRPLKSSKASSFPRVPRGFHRDRRGKPSLIELRNPSPLPPSPRLVSSRRVWKKRGRKTRAEPEELEGTADVNG